MTILSGNVFNNYTYVYKFKNKLILFNKQCEKISEITFKNSILNVMII
jgi:hypothetical protein